MVRITIRARKLTVKILIFGNTKYIVLCKKFIVQYCLKALKICIKSPALNSLLHFVTSIEYIEKFVLCMQFFVHLF